MAIHKHFSLQHSVSPLTRLTPCHPTPPFSALPWQAGLPPFPCSWRMVRQNESNKIMANAIFGIFTPSRRKRREKLTNFAKSFSNFASFHPPLRFSNCLCCAPFNQEKHFLLCKIMTLFLFCCSSSCCYNDYGCCRCRCWLLMSKLLLLCRQL